MKERLRIPAEWEQHDCCWLAFPHLAEEWPFNLEAAQHAIAALCRTIAEAGNEPVRLLVKDQNLAVVARNLIGGSSHVDYVTTDYGDCWVRDTLPLLGHTPSGTLGALGFRFNGWGRKFDIPFDVEVGRWLTEHLGARHFESDLVLEGGALEFDGQGTFITTKSCALNDNRNPNLGRADVENALSSLVSVERVIWLERGLNHDHTDGHVDMIARFVASQTRGRELEKEVESVRQFVTSGWLRLFRLRLERPPFANLDEAQRRAKEAEEPARILRSELRYWHAQAGRGPSDWPE